MESVVHILVIAGIKTAFVFCYCTFAKFRVNAVLCGSHLFRLLARTEVFQICSGIFVQIT